MKKTTWLLIIALFTILAIIFIPRKGNKEYAKLYPKLSSPISSLTIQKTNYQLKLFQNSDGAWEVQENNKKSFPATALKTKELVKLLEKERELEIVSEKVDGYPRYGLDNNKIVVVAYDKDNKVLRSFSIGNSAPSFSASFLLWNDQPTIYQTSDDLQDKFKVSLNDLRDKTIFSFKSDSVKKLVLEKDNTKTSIEKFFPKGPTNRQNFSWKDKQGITYSIDAVNDVINTLANLQAENFATQQEANSVLQKAEKVFNARFQIILDNENTYFLTMVKKNDDSSDFWIFNKDYNVAALSYYDAEKLNFDWETLKK